MSTSDKMSRRTYVKTVGTAVAGLAVGSIIGYGASEALRPPVTLGPAVTQTVTETAGPTGPAIKEIKIALLDMMTGGGGAAGEEAKRIFDQYIEDYNAAGGVRRGPLKGAKITVVYADTQTRTEVARSEAERLVTSGEVCLIMGALWTSQTMPIKEVCDRYEFPLLNTGASNIALTQGANNKWFWRTMDHDAMFNQRIFAFQKDLQKKTGVQVKSLGLIYANDSYGIGWRDYVVNEMNKDKELGGYDIACDIPVVVGTPSVDSEVLAIRKAAPDILHMATHRPESILITKALRQYDVNQKLIIEQSSEILDTRYGDAVGKIADGQCSRAVSASDLNKPNTKAFSEKYKAKWNYDVGDWSSSACIQAATGMFENVLEPSVEPKVIQRAFNSLYIPAEELFVPWGIKFYPPGMFDAGQNMLASCVVEQYTGAYELHTVWPWDVASKEIVFPVPSYSARGI